MTPPAWLTEAAAAELARGLGTSGLPLLEVARRIVESRHLYREVVSYLRDAVVGDLALRDATPPDRTLATPSEVQAAAARMLAWRCGRGARTHHSAAPGHR